MVTASSGKQEGPKKQHFVPVMLLARFARPDGRFFFHDRRLPENLIRPTTPENIMHQRYLYSPQDDGGRRDFSLERRYSKIENAASQLLDRIEIVLAKAIDPVLEGTNRGLLDLFISEQWRRVPDIHEQVLTSRRFQLHLDAAIKTLEATNGPFSQHRKDELIKSIDTPEARKQIPGRALKKSTGKILEIFGAKRLVVVEAPDGAEFITGSNPVVKTSDRSSDLRHESIEIWLAFHPRFAAVLVGREDLAARVVTTAGHVHWFNEAVARGSSIIASKNVGLLQALRPGSKLKS